MTNAIQRIEDLKSELSTAFATNVDNDGILTTTLYYALKLRLNFAPESVSLWVTNHIDTTGEIYLLENQSNINILWRIRSLIDDLIEEASS